MAGGVQRDLLFGVVWEVELTDTALEDAKAFFQPRRERNTVKLVTLGRESRRSRGAGT